MSLTDTTGKAGGMKIIRDRKGRGKMALQAPENTEEPAQAGKERNIFWWTATISFLPGRNCAAWLR